MNKDLSKGLSKIPAKAGVGLRSVHFKEFIEKRPLVPWLEVHPENFQMGSSLKKLEKIRQDYPLSLHGVGLSLGSPTVQEDHLKFLKSLCERLDPGLVSEHVSWSIIDGVYLNDLLPLPYTEESLEVLISNIQQTQEYLGRQILIENPSSYLTFSHSTLSEWEFIKEAAARSGSKILLDINNIYVSSQNHNFSPKLYLDFLDPASIGEIHLAGHARMKLGKHHSILIDDHGSQVSSNVWDLYEYALKKVGPVPTLIEWDSNIPSLSILLEEAQKAQDYLDTVRCS